MQILIVDDETLAISRLQRMLKELGFQNILSASDTQQAFELIESHSFDLIFLDINMPKMSGMDLAYELKKTAIQTAIIFQTAYEEYALKAFDVEAMGYLVKPYSIEQLENVIKRVQNTLQTQDLRIMSKMGENYLFLKPQQIYYVEADLSEVILRSDEGFSYYAKKISDMEKFLEKHNFIRVHRSYLINVDKIKELSSGEQSRLTFTFHGIKDEVESSKSGAKKFREIFK
jgi:two-component system, LytTR family, response regulator